ncbi:hypothetical protein K4F52_001518 [Lecanicillium sp. MT-2017a]|nr:hypothetical protein K4F52_001518 [Lecanicillium sp. MT-2017a]
MKFFAVAALVASAMAAPALEAREVCPGGLTNSNAKCCAVDVLGVLSLDCTTPKESPRDGKDLAKICAADGGKAAACCTLPVAGQGVICAKVVGA